MGIQRITVRGQDGGPEFVTVHVSHIKYHKFTRELYALLYAFTIQPYQFLGKSYFW